MYNRLLASIHSLFHFHRENPLPTCVQQLAHKPIRLGINLVRSRSPDLLASLLVRQHEGMREYAWCVGGVGDGAADGEKEGDGRGGGAVSCQCRVSEDWEGMRLREWVVTRDGVDIPGLDFVGGGGEGLPVCLFVA